MSTPTILENLVKGLPVVTSLSNRTVLSCDSNGSLGRCDNSLISTKSIASPSSAVQGDWIRVAKLCSGTSGLTSFALVSIVTYWGTNQPRNLSFFLWINTATWDWSKGNTNESFVLSKITDTTNGLFSKLRLVVEISGSHGTVYLELYTTSTIADMRRPRVTVLPLYGSPEALSAVAGSIPSGAISEEFTFSSLFGGGG